METDLEERLLSARNLIELTLLAMEHGRNELLPTPLEELFFLTQNIALDYCVKE